MKIDYAKSASKAIGAFDSKFKQRIKKAIEEDLTKTPPQGDIKPLKGYDDGRLRLRKGGFRVVFKYKDVQVDGKPAKMLYIIDIGARGDIYK